MYGQFDSDNPRFCRDKLKHLNLHDKDPVFDLLDKIFISDVDQRISALDALKHPYLG